MQIAECRMPANYGEDLCISEAFCYTACVTLDEYTPDAICQAMGLSAFVEPEWVNRAELVMRVLLKPSFHPEICVTIGGAGDLSVVTFDKKSFWHSSPGELLTTWREEKPITSQTCIDLTGIFRETQESLDKSKSYICCDGMGIDACLISARDRTEFSGNVGGQRGIHAFVRAVAETSWNSCSRAEVRNSLSAALYYVGGDQPQSEGEGLPVVKIGVFGDDREREELLRAIQKKTGGTFGGPN
jgi:hypothetical protein